jgi:FkbM family methyltransferase
MLTAAVRDLHMAHRGEFETDVRTSVDAIWQHNPNITPLNEGDPSVQSIDMHYPLIHESNQRPYHFIHGYPQFLEQQLGLKIPVTRFCGDIHLSPEERQAPPPGAELGVPEHFWIVIAGGKYDFTAKWWNPESSQAVVDHFEGKIQFVQCGEAGHWHPPLERVVNLVGKTDTRQFIRLMHHADGVLCPVTFAMHLAAAVETKPGRPRHRPCVVVAGGREPAHWEAYSHHQFISTVGALPCCADGGCWKSRCQTVSDGDPKDHHDVCLNPVQVRSDLRIPRCMELVTPQQVIERIELYYHGGALHYGQNGTNGHLPAADKSPAPIPDSQNPEPETRPAMNALITFRHGLGDAVQLTIVLKHLQKYRPEWAVDVAALIGKHTAFGGLCRKVYILEREAVPCCGGIQRFNLDWHECHTSFADSPSTKVERCLREEFGITPDPELCSYSIQVSDEALDRARGYLEQICKGAKEQPDFPNSQPRSRFPVVLIHYEGNTSADFKNIPTDIVRRLCDDIIDAGYVPVILDWDRRTPLADGVRIFNPHADTDLWMRTGTGDAETLAALMQLSTLVIGVDSGPLHVAGATSTATLAVWTRHHPLHYFALAQNVTHLVPRNHAELIRGDRSVGEAYFNGHYRFAIYDDLEIGLRAAVRSRLEETAGDLIFTRNFWIRSDTAEQDLVIVKDVAEDDSYQIDAMPMPRPVVVDVGAHIGCFSKRLHDRNPLARIFTVECCPENVAALTRNVGEFATVVQGAMTYEPDVALLNAVYANCHSTGGSTVIRRSELARRVTEGTCAEEPGNDMPGEYWADFRPMRCLTLEELMQEHGLDHIDILKLDCEGSEFSILGKTRSLDRIGLIVGEYHGEANFARLVEERFADWELKILRTGEIGTFWLTNPHAAGQNSIELDAADTQAQSTLAISNHSAPRYDPVLNRRLYDHLHTTGFSEAYYQEHKAGGLDYLAFGRWQIEYAHWLIESLGWKEKSLLDVGCACGSMVRGFSEGGVKSWGIDLNEYMIASGRAAFPELASRLLICDAVNLHLFDDASYEGVHSAQVAEHWKPELVPHILRELARVTVPGGLFFCNLDTEELFDRQNRRLEDDDPTHVCIHSLDWWHEQLDQAGWQVCSNEFEAILRSHSGSFPNLYDWDWFVARRLS